MAPPFRVGCYFMSLFFIMPIERRNFLCVLGEYWTVAGSIPVEGNWNSSLT